MLAFENANILIVGDVMLDRYWYGEIEKISSEAPVSVIKVKRQHESPGGAGNVALNIRSLGATVTLMGILGNDPAASTIEAKLEKSAVKNIFLRDDRVQTPTKLRVISDHQQLLRIDAEKNYHQIEKDELVNRFNKTYQSTDLIVLSDYAKGTLSDPQAFISVANKAQIPVLVDPKGKDFSRYRGASLLTPNRKEFEAVVGPCANDSELIEKGRNLLAQYEFGALLVTRGEHGMTLLRQDQPAIHLPAESREVYDVTGAGDTVIAVLASALAVGASLEDAMKLANHAAGIVVTRLGTTSITTSELIDRIQLAGQDEAAFLSRSQLAAELAIARSSEQKIVMVHGKFDVLHAGVVEFLRYAKRLGDVLLIAVEDDPMALIDKPFINTLKHRITVLQALQAVDWVIPYQKASLEQLVKEISADVVMCGDPAAANSEFA